MVDLATVFSVVIGGVLALLGTLLANFLQYRSEKRELKKERAKERHMEVRRYLATCLQFADLISIPTTLGPKDFGPDESREFMKLVSEHLDQWKSLPISSSARVIYVEDEKILQWLEQIDTLRIWFFLNYRSLIREGQMISLEDKRQELRQLSAKVASHLDQLLDQI